MSIFYECYSPEEFREEIEIFDKLPEPFKDKLRDAPRKMSAWAVADMLSERSEDEVHEFIDFNSKYCWNSHP